MPIRWSKDARFVPTELKEKWPAAQRRFINLIAQGSGAPRLVELSHPAVEAGVFESSEGAVLVLANFKQGVPPVPFTFPLRHDFAELTVSIHIRKEFQREFNDTKLE